MSDKIKLISGVILLYVLFVLLISYRVSYDGELQVVEGRATFDPACPVTVTSERVWPWDAGEEYTYHLHIAPGETYVMDGPVDFGHGSLHIHPGDESTLDLGRGCFTLGALTASG